MSVETGAGFQLPGMHGLFTCGLPMLLCRVERLKFASIAYAFRWWMKGEEVTGLSAGSIGLSDRL